MPARIRVIIADDHPIFREGLRKVIARAPDVAVVGEAADGTEAIVQVLAERPDVAVLDLDMPKQDGFAVVRAAREAGLATKMIILTMHRHEELFNRALNLGVDGFLLKDGAVTEIVAAITAVVAGRPFISQGLSAYLLNRRAASTRLAQTKPTLADLTPAERRILALIADHKTSREIADVLAISPRTVDHHRANICTKLELHGFNALVKFAAAHRAELS